MKYRKKPVEVEAQRITIENIHDIAKWCEGRVFNAWTREKQPRQTLGLSVTTLEGTMTCYVGDYLICGVKGEFYPCRGDIFEETYEPAEA